MRRIIAILVLSMLLAGCSGASETDTNATGTNPSSTPSQFHISPGQASSTPSELNGTFNVDGHDLFLSCTGNGEPTMILEAGEAVPSDAMDAVRAAYDSDLRVCSYDRANQGQSGIGTHAADRR